MSVSGKQPGGKDEAYPSSPDVGVSNKPWKYLSRFEITCKGRSKAHCPVYANDRQQIPIEILIEAKDEDGVVVDLPEDGFAITLRLVDYSDPGEYARDVKTAISEDTLYVYDWAVQYAESDGAHDEDAPSSAPEVGRARVYRRWLYTDRVRTSKLAARCTSPDGVIFITNTPNPAPGKFDSYVIVDGREPKALPWGCFAMSGPHNAANTPNFDVDLYYIYFTDPNYRIVNSVNHRYPNIQRGAHYGWNKDSGRMEHIAFHRAGRRQETHTSCIGHGYVVSFIVDDKPGQATAARIRDGMGKMCHNFSYQHGLVGYIDQFGNESKVMLRAASDGNTMSLGNPAKADDVEPPSDAESTSS